MADPAVSIPLQSLLKSVCILHSRTTPSEFLRASTFLHRLTGSICLGAVPCPYMFPIHFRSHTHPQSPHIPHFVHVDSIPAKTSARGAAVGPRSRPWLPVPWTFHHHAIMSNTAKSPASHPPRPATAYADQHSNPPTQIPRDCDGGPASATTRRRRRHRVGVGGLVMVRFEDRTDGSPKGGLCVSTAARLKASPLQAGS